MATEWRKDRAQRVAIVTGGSRGVGKATIHRLAALGYTVVVNYAHDRPQAEAIVELILGASGDALAVRADVHDELDVARLFAETVEAFGGVDVVVHTVVAPVAVTTIAGADLGQFSELCRINQNAMLIVNRQAARDLRHGGALVNLTSVFDASSPPTLGLYAATRAATDVLTRTLAAELRHRWIAVAAVALEADRPCVPEVVADAVAFLVGDHGRTLTGHILRVDDPRLRHALSKEESK